MSYLPPMERIDNIDNSGRRINYLRISVTDRCNLACRYCVPKEQIPLLSHDKIARYEEILRIVEIAAQLGITKVRITGGEPFVRKGIFTFLKELGAISGIRDIGVTTNGVLLEKQLKNILRTNVRRMNISLDTLVPEKFRQITGKDHFHQVWRGIMAANEAGIAPIKLNCVVMRGVNDDEISDLATLAEKHPFHVRFIEYMPMGNSAMEQNQEVLVPEIKAAVEKRLGALAPVESGSFDGPAKRFKPENAPGEIGFISPVSSHFCHQCNRLRLTSTGRLRPCLLKNDETDILGPLRRGASPGELRQIFRTTLKNKPLSHSLDTDQVCRISSQMSAIGG